MRKPDVSYGLTLKMVGSPTSGHRFENSPSSQVVIRKIDF